MKFLFVIGVEGTGHHMIGSILSDYTKRDDSVFEGEWHDLLANHWDYEKFKKHEGLFSFIGQKDLKDKLKNIFQKYEANQVKNLFEHTSFPYEQPRESLRRPDIINFEELTKDTIDVKYLVLYRNPIAATYSAIRRKFTDNVYYQARIAESNYIYIERQFSQVPDNKYRVVHFEEFLENPEHYGKKLSEWWELEHEVVEVGLKNLRKPSGMSKIPGDSRKFLENFFSEARLNQWQEFYNSNKL
ncbi:MAG: hypothetical protein ACFB0E_11375 [Leptolyngbyaceae cyanobacterium]